MKKILLVVVVFILGVVVTLLTVRFLSGEDGWICIGGEWVKHGQPSAPQPSKDCKLVDDLKPEEPVKEEPENLVSYGDAIQLREPVATQVVVSPLKVTGNVLANWTFEASFGLELLDSYGRSLATAPGNAPGWTNGGFIPFEGTLVFDAPVTDTGTLRLSNDNASGLPENDKWVDVPVSFVPAPTTAVKVFFMQTDKNGGVGDCSEVYSVERLVLSTKSIGTAAINELLYGVLPSEKNEGYFTSINPGVKLNSLKIENGIAYADFDEMLQFQVGGSCKIATIRAQITETLKQFSTVKKVIISINGESETILQP